CQFSGLNRSLDQTNKTAAAAGTDAGARKCQRASQSMTSSKLTKMTQAPASIATSGTPGRVAAIATMTSPIRLPTTAAAVKETPARSSNGISNLRARRNQTKPNAATASAQRMATSGQ